MFSLTRRVFAPKFTPLGQRVLVQRVEAAKQTKAGILIPEQAKAKINEGKVVAVAAANNEWKPTVKAGDTVLLPEFGGSAIKLEGADYHLYNEEQILGVLN